MKYLVVVPVKAFPIDSERFAMESAFCDHLKELLAGLSPPFDELCVAASGMSRDEYETNRAHLGVLDHAHDRVRLEVLHPASDGRLRFARRFPSMLRSIHRLVRSHDLVHAGPSHDLTRPTTSAALALAVWMNKPCVSVADIDLRSDAVMNRQLGRWSLKSYLLCRYVYDPIRHLQHEAAARACSLVLYKDETLRDDFGRGRPNVRVMRDPGFSARHVIPRMEIERKIEALLDPRRPLELLSFGRLTYYKGVDRSIAAVARLRDMGRRDVRLTIIGAGEEEPRLRALVRARRLEDLVVIRPPIRYGDAFFAMLRPHHLALITPLTNDTPRSTWDALASGVPVLAFDTEFYRGLAQATRAVETVEWPSVEALAGRIARYADRRAELAPRIEEAVRAAQANTAERWLRLRAQWTREIVRQGGPRIADVRSGRAEHRVLRRAARA